MNTPPCIITDQCLPESMAFSGFVVYLPQGNEFLAYINKSHGLVQKAFTRLAEHAVVFHSMEEALESAQLCREITEPACLYKYGDEYLVARSEPRRSSSSHPGVSKSGTPELAIFARLARQLKARFKMGLQ